MLTTSNYGLKKPESTDPVSINDFNDNADTIDTALAKKLESTSKAGDMTTEFSQASNRTNLISGEAIKTSLGKIMKYFTDLKGAAFAAIANNLTTTTAGSVLDATQGKALDGKITDLSSEIGDVNTNLQTKVNDALSSIASLNTDLATVNSSIDYLYGTVVNLDSSIGYLQSGFISVTPTAANVTTDAKVTFRIPFPAAPSVQLTTVTSIPHQVGVAVHDVTKTGFTIKLNRPDIYATYVHWIAMPVTQ